MERAMETCSVRCFLAIRGYQHGATRSSLLEVARKGVAMRYALILCLLVCGCAKVHAQGANAPFHSEGDKCKVGNYFGHFVGHGNNDMWALECVADDGKPPVHHYIPARRCRQSEGCASSLGPDVDIPAQDYWTCGKGYELNGFKVTWPDGVAKLEPERCKARP
jgi:hypothetical protein